ncbi:MAG: F0F1 ATP synthase subunit delta [Mycoplasma sp.]|nr:F0F1 ATP synthase subunit delta [Mycoplasma sp.]
MEHKIIGYSLALLELSQEEKKLKEYKEQIDIICNLFKENEEYINIIDSHNLETKTKQNLVKKLFSEKVEESLINFILILIAKKEVKIMMSTFKKTINLINDLIGINEGVVYSSEKLTPELISQIEKTTSNKLGVEVKLWNKVDVKLISGIRVVVNGEVIDNSLQSQLDLLEKELKSGVK